MTASRARQPSAMLRGQPSAALPRVAGLAAACCLSAASAVHLEVYYGPYCPNSANYLTRSVRPLIDAKIPGLVMTMLPYAIEPSTGSMPRPCPSHEEGTPCGVLAAPLCALQPFVASMPHALTPDFAHAADFAICDLVHANHGAPAFLMHTQADIATCAHTSGADWDSIADCMAAAVPSRAYVERLEEANARLPPGRIAPFVFVNGAFVENTEPLLPRICAAEGNSAECNAAFEYYRLFDSDIPQVSRRSSWIAACGLGSSLVALAALTASRWRGLPRGFHEADDPAYFRVCSNAPDAEHAPSLE